MLWASLIFYVSSIPNLRITQESLLQHIINNLGHFTEYCVLTLLVLSSQTKDKLTKVSIPNAFLFAFAYSISDELHQLFVPGRMTDIWDIAVDVLGIIIATKIWKNRQNLRILQKYA